MAGEEPSRDADAEAGEADDGAEAEEGAGRPDGEARDDSGPDTGASDAGGEGTPGADEGGAGVDATDDESDGKADDLAPVDADELTQTAAEVDDGAPDDAEREAVDREAVEADVRSALDAEVRDESGAIEYATLRQVAADTDGVPGSGLTKEEMYEAVLEARVGDELGEGPEDAGVGPVAAAGPDEYDSVEAEADALVEQMERAEADAGRDAVTEASTEAALDGMEGESVPLTGDPDSAETGWPSQTGPEEDREMPLTEHVEEMLKRLAVVIAVAGIVSLAVLPFGDDVINFLWYNILPGVETDIARPRLYSVLELWFTRIKVASLAGIIVALPVLVYEAYAFMKPGLYPHERRYYLAAIPTSLVLAIVGVSFAYFVVLPAIFVYFLYYSQDVATIGFALGRTFDLILLLMGYMALVFQIPLFLMLAMMMNLVTRRWLADRRLLFWGAFLGISFIFSPDPTGMAPIIVAATMIVLFEGTLLLTKWTGRA